MRRLFWTAVTFALYVLMMGGLRDALVNALAGHHLPSVLVYLGVAAIMFLAGRTAWNRACGHA